MKTENQLKPKNDAIILVALFEIAGLLFLLTSSALSAGLRLAFIISLLLSIPIAFFGKQRRIGFVAAFFASALFSPLIGLIITMGSSKLEDEAYKEKMLAATENNTRQSTVADQILKLNELRKEGVLTDEEFAIQKEKLLNS
jgi:hypothetical protein